MAKIFAWSAFTIIALLLSLYPLRRLAQNDAHIGGISARALYRPFRRLHKPLGILAIPVVFFHCGMVERAGCAPSILGPYLLLLVILLALSNLLRKPLGRSWRYAHDALSTVLASGVVIHVLYFCLH